MNVHNPCMQVHTHASRRAVGLLCNLSHSFSGENMFYHFISFLSSVLPPSLHFLTQQHVALPRLLCWNHRPHPALWQQPRAFGDVILCVCVICVCVLVLLSLCGAIFCCKPALLGHICFVRTFSPHKRTIKQWTRTRLKWSQSKAFYLKVKHSYWAWELNKCCSVVFPLFALIWFICVPNNSCKFCH